MSSSLEIRCSGEGCLGLIVQSIMIIILPLGHENMEAQRFPYITMGIILLNVVIFVITHFLIAPQTAMVRDQREEVLMNYYQNHPYLNLPEETFQLLSPESKHLIYHIRRVGMEDMMMEVNFRDTQLQDMEGRISELQQDGSFVPQQEEESREERMKRMMAEQQERLDELIAEFHASVDNDFYMRYAYVPARGNIMTMFTSMFLHAGFLHLLGNLLFLWLSGCNIEDLWGRIVYPIFYVVGGLLAAYAHGLMLPESQVPLLGASGAIAATMGAFMIRMYKTRIYFVYIIFMLRIMRGRFMAPAYIMLPLWLLQQAWGLLFSVDGGGGVAFWAHIGGFVFGACVATLFKVTGFEENVLAPAIDKKTAIVDEHLASGIEKLRDGQVDGAIQDLRKVLQQNPNDVIARSELSKAYFAKGKKDLALREFKRVVYLHLKRGEMDAATDEYIEMSTEMPDMMLDPPQQVKIAHALEQRAQQELGHYDDEETAVEKERDMYRHAALAYRQLIAYYHRKAKSLDDPKVVEALSRYADICLQHLEQPQDAYKAYQMLLKGAKGLSSEEKQRLQANAQHAKELIAQQARKQQLVNVKKKREAGTSSVMLNNKAAKGPKKPDIPLMKRIKVVQEGPIPGKYDIGTVTPLEANKVHPAADGLDLKRPAEAPLFFDNIYMICMGQVPEITQRVKQVKKRTGRGRTKTDYVKYNEKHEHIIVDLFIGGKSRPYRIYHNRINYQAFFSKPLANSIDNFRQFLLHIISHIDSVYLDQKTLDFLRTGKIPTYSEAEDLEIREKTFWKQLYGAVRFQCTNCWAVYWVDGDKIPEGGARTTCAKCKQPVQVQKPLRE